MSIAPPATTEAIRMKNPKIMNMIILGAYLHLKPVVGFDSVMEALKEVLPEKYHHLLPLNEQALEKGEQISYGACGLPYLLEGQVRDWRQLEGYTPDSFLRAKNVSVRTRSEVAAITHARRELTLHSGEKLHYDKLVITAGGAPARSRNVAA